MYHGINESTLTTFIQVEIILIAELLGATSKEYIVFPEKVLKAGNLVKIEMRLSVTFLMF